MYSFEARHLAIAGFYLDGDDYEAYPAEQSEIDKAQEFTDRYDREFVIAFPDKHEMRDCDIMEEYAESQPEARIANQLMYSIRGKGAFRKFRETVTRFGFLDDWYAFKDSAMLGRTRQWCVRNGVDYEPKIAYIGRCKLSIGHEHKNYRIHPPQRRMLQSAVLTVYSCFALPILQSGDVLLTIGIPKALLYYRYHVLWEHFFHALGLETIVSGDTNREILSDGEAAATDECCLPFKLCLGHVLALDKRCDLVFAPRMAAEGRGEEFCPRLHGLYDTLRHTFPGCALLCQDLGSHTRTGERAGFVRLGLRLGKSPCLCLKAYREAKEAQRENDRREQAEQRRLLSEPGVKILLAGAPYLVRDPYTGAPLGKMLRELGAIVLYTDRCDREAGSQASAPLAPGLRWTTQRETAGAAALYARKASGVILVSAYPCGPDALVNELLARALGQMPILRLSLDGQESETGLRTRLESFMDIINTGR